MSNKVSIITVVYNGEKVLEETVVSIINQTYENIEYIIIDGYSKDNTKNIIKKYENNIDIFISEQDKGIYDAMNKGLKLATGNYITFLNAGDTYINYDVIKNLFTDIKDDVDVVYGDHIAILNENQTYRSAKAFTVNNLCNYLTSTVCHQAIFVKKNIAPFYSLEYQLKSELDWYFDILKDKNIKYIHKKIPVVYYLRGGVGEKRYILNLKEILLVLKKNCKFPTILKSYKFLLKYTIKILFIIAGRYKFEK